MMQYLWKVFLVIYVKWQELEAFMNDDDAFDREWMDFESWRETRIRT